MKLLLQRHITDITLYGQNLFKVTLNIHYLEKVFQIKVVYFDEIYVMYQFFFVQWTISEKIDKIRSELYIKEELYWDDKNRN
jgi:hypothetical protein